MTMILWANSGRDVGTDLGDFFQLMGDFADMAKCCGEENYQNYLDMFGVPEACGQDDDCDPGWLGTVRDQAKDFLNNYGDKVRPTSRRTLETLARMTLT